MARTLPRLAVLFSALGVVQLGFVACGGSDEVRHAMDEGGAAGEGGEKSSGGSSSGSAGRPGGGSGGLASTQGGAGAGAVNAGAGGESEAQVGGAAGSANGAAGAPLGGVGGMSEAGAAGGGGMSDAGGAGGSGAEPCVAEGSRITIGFNAANAEWVNNLQWLDNSNTLIANVAAFGGSSICGDPPEFFGESYGAPEGTTPGIVVAGSRSAGVACGLDINISNVGVQDCLLRDQVPTTTEYHFYKGAKESQMRVTRTIGFNATSPATSDDGLRVWQPRVGLDTWGNVIYPNAAGTAVTPIAAGSCPGDCPIATGATWNGQWFADLTADGHAMIVRRDPSMTAPVSLTVNYDSYSNANLTSFVAVKPQAGWVAPITEVEYLCFADLTSWPQTDRNAAVLPSWCGP